MNRPIARLSLLLGLAFVMIVPAYGQTKPGANGDEVDRPGPGDFEPYWKEGYQSGLEGMPKSETYQNNEDFRHGYDAAKRRIRLNAEKRTLEGALRSAAGRPSGMARTLAERFIGHINAMNLQSATLYELLHATNTDFEQVVDTKLTLRESIARTEYVLERARFTLRTHALFHEHAYAAAQLQPQLIAALKSFVEELKKDIERMDFKASKELLYVKSMELETEVQAHEKRPVSLPDEFEKMGRYVKESLVVMEKVIQTDRIRETLSPEDFSSSAMLLSLGEFKDFYSTWREGQLKMWREGSLPGYYDSLGVSPPNDISKKAREATAQFVAYQSKRRGTDTAKNKMEPGIAFREVANPDDASVIAVSPPTVINHEPQTGMWQWFYWLASWVGQIILGFVLVLVGLLTVLAILAAIFGR